MYDGTQLRKTHRAELSSSQRRPTAVREGHGDLPRDVSLTTDAHVTLEDVAHVWTYNKSIDTQICADVAKFISVSF